MNHTRLALRDVIDQRFTMLNGTTRYFRNRDYRTLDIVAHDLNLLEVRDRKVISRLAFRHGREEIFRPTQSLAECYFDKLSFGWADVREGAPFLLIRARANNLTASRIARWLRNNCQYDLLTLEGSEVVRASFESEEDFMLARLHFT